MNASKKIVIFLVLFICLTVTIGYLLNHAQLQRKMDSVLQDDVRNRGIYVSVHYRNYVQMSVLTYDLRTVSGTNSMTDVFRVLLQFADKIKEKKFDSVELRYRGKVIFSLRGQTLGIEYASQNPVYTVRTFPEHLLNPDGSKAYGEWVGGLIGVLSTQLEDVNDFHKKWYLDETIKKTESHTTASQVNSQIASSASAASAPGTASPFGLQKGMSLNQIGGGSPMAAGRGMYTLTQVPKPHSAFESYILQIGPTSGLCWIKAVGKNVSTSVYGSELRSTFDDMKRKLDQTYGTSELIDRLLPGSIWNEPKDWMMALIKKERFLIAAWNNTSKAKLPPDLKQVGLVASPVGTNSAYITVEYSFTNESKCEAEIGKKEDSAL